MTYWREIPGGAEWRTDSRTINFLPDDPHPLALYTPGKSYLLPRNWTAV